VIPQNHVESSRGRLGKAPRRHRCRERDARPPAALRPCPDVWTAQLAHAPSQRTHYRWGVITHVTRRARAQSASISEGPLSRYFQPRGLLRHRGGRYNILALSVYSLAGFELATFGRF
jgi:hypothetical protein